MKKDTKTNTPPSTKKARIALAATTVVALLIVAWVGIYAWGNSAYHSPDVPHPLGDKLTYIGKSDYGCTGLCDSGPSTTYYYATDMNIEEVEQYFTKAKVEYPPDRESSNTRIWLKAASGESFVLRYYDDKDLVVKKYSLTASQKKHITSLDSINYRPAKDSL